jgi:Asp-tRNA(Asn)/Glu-tRNA(Gln) amidotransferase A subunit family amidase
MLSECLARISQFNSVYRAFSHLTSETAVRSAPGPLEGVAVSIKGSLPVAGLPWTEGSAVYAGRIASYDAAVVARARAAGAAILGTTTLSELAMYGVTNPFEPMGLNPWDPDRTAGGSSTGAGVAAALGMARINIGSDSGGSIRNPACHCGVVGFMPRVGALPLEGSPNYTPSLSTIGLIARSVPDAEMAYSVLADAPLQARPARRLLIPRTLVAEMCDDETQALFSAALAHLSGSGFDCIDAEIPRWLNAERAAGVISLFECGQALAHMDLSVAGEGIRARAANAQKITSADLTDAKIECAAFRQNVAHGLRISGADAIATPTWPFAAPPLDAHSVAVKGKTVPVDPHRNCFVRAANAIDACAITLPMGLYPSAQVPAGLHLIADGGAEPALLAVARAVEVALPALPPPPPLRPGYLRTPTSR